MPSTCLSQLAAVFHQITGPRHKRGVRHPFAGMLALVLLKKYGSKRSPE